MLTRIRSTWFAGAGAVLLVLVVSGAVAASSLLTAISIPTDETAPPTEVADTTLTYEDLDGNGVDDDCQEAVVPDAEAAAAALLAADLDGDGKVSVSEAAQTGWTGGTNCNHGGYVSGVAKADDTCDEATETDTDDPAETGDADEVSVVLVAETVECEAPVEETAEEETPTECTTEETPETEPVVEEEEPVDPAPNAHGKAVSDVAQSDAVGGKNCNHGGAVSEAAKKDHDAAKAERDAAKAARDAAKAERAEQREARKDAQQAKQHGKKGG
jgi:hypothetical protein